MYALSGTWGGQYSLVLGRPRQPLNNNKGHDYGRWTSAAWRQAIVYGVETASTRSPSSIAPACDLRTMLNGKGGADSAGGYLPLPYHHQHSVRYLIRKRGQKGRDHGLVEMRPSNSYKRIHGNEYLRSDPDIPTL